MAVKIGAEGVVEFQLTTMDGRETPPFLVDVAKAAYAIKAIADECGEDERMVGERVHQMVAGDILRDDTLVFSYFTIAAFSKAIFDEAAELKKKIWGEETTQGEPPVTGSTS